MLHYRIHSQSCCQTWAILATASFQSIEILALVKQIMLILIIVILEEYCQISASLALFWTSYFWRKFDYIPIFIGQLKDNLNVGLYVWVPVCLRANSTVLVIRNFTYRNRTY